MFDRPRQVRLGAQPTSVDQDGDAAAIELLDDNLDVANLLDAVLDRVNVRIVPGALGRHPKTKDLRHA